MPGHQLSERLFVPEARLAGEDLIRDDGGTTQVACSS